MTNERLRTAIHTSGLRVEEVAERLGCDRKTVERWVDGQIPYRRNQHAVAQLLRAEVAYLWPPSTAEQSAELGMAEMLAIWPVRSMVPNTLWVDLFRAASRQIDVLVYAGFWLSEDPAVRDTLTAKSRSGVPVRLLLGDPASDAVRRRGAEEGIGDAISAKIANTIHNYGELLAAPSTQAQLHATTLYASIYRADDDMLVNSHIYGLPGHMTPLHRLRRMPGAQLFAAYADCFERVWAEAVPLTAAAAVA